MDRGADQGRAPSGGRRVKPGLTLALPPAMHDLVLEHCEREGLTFGQLVRREVSGYPGYVAAISAAQRNGGDVAEVVGRCAAEAMAALCQRLEVERAIRELTDER